MGTYYIPRNLKGETRILYIFSIRGLLYTGAGAVIGLVFMAIFRACGLTLVGIVAMLVFSLIGYILGTFKVPEIRFLKATKKVSGEKIDDIIVRYFKFNYDSFGSKKKKKIYVYTKEEK